ncbi:BadF/BadG/BcrA/BcrD ATPase family protein [Neptunicella marina]|uniref:ATPase n=1 Tax=Neptunicella marina TaxID=2125989 RepID=A0A8J6ITM9_9ALTE|nr:BadF/BadG/BcrA/BcrD ATPase family protein [Neptunicella marina]MBC3765630.1 ATPase [Neptunicella marina]
MVIEVAGTGLSGEPTPLYFVGIDGGATHCRAQLFDKNHKLLGMGKAGPANPVNGLKQTCESIVTATQQALSDAGINNITLAQLSVGAGLAGLHLPAMQQAMAKWQHPFADLFLTTDLHAAVLGAHDGNDGAVIILGTGFSALGVVAQQQFPIGGYGFPIYATCSGSWFGLELIKAILLDADGVGVKTSLTKAILSQTDILTLAEKMNNAPAQEFARLAPFVFEHAAKGDALSLSLLQQGADFINRVMQRLIDNGVKRITFVGGVAPHIQHYLSPALRHYVVEAKASPEFGAMLLANRTNN